MPRPKPAPTPAHKPHPVSRAEFARRSGRSRGAITQACAGPLEAAQLPKGRLDAAHSAAVNWAKSRGIDPVQLLDPELAKSAPKAGPLQKPAIDVPKSVSDLLQLTFAEISERYASFEGFSDWLDARKKVGEIDRLETQNRERRGELVSRELVKTHVFGPIHTGFEQLIRDVPRTAAARVIPMAKRNDPIQEIEKVIAEQITATLKPMIAEAVRKAKRLGRPRKDSPDANQSP